MASKKNGVLYIGVTNNLLRRIYEHKQKITQGFSSKYFVHRLVHYEEYGNIFDAMQREKYIKAWKRNWKIELIERHNSEWNDLSGDI